jgi:hypothetical protein
MADILVAAGAAAFPATRVDFASLAVTAAGAGVEEIA